MSNRRLLVLVSLSDQPKHGYAIQQDVEEFAGVRLGPGTLYGAIDSLDRDGLIRPQHSDDRRRVYELTAAGRRALREELDALAMVLRRAEAAGA